MISQFSSVFGFGYQHVIKPIFFRIDAETVHNFMVHSGELVGEMPIVRKLFRILFHFDSQVLSQRIKGIYFTNPVGLSAGFDKNAELISIMED